MTEEPTIKIDAKGLMCPRPIIELAKAKRLAKPGARIEIVADDLAFESDVQAWCETTGNTLVDLTRDDYTLTARIELSE
jgi:tRNA 2-thiouridine synthesizing protein A